MQPLTAIRHDLHWGNRAHAGKARAPTFMHNTSSCSNKQVNPTSLSCNLSTVRRCDGSQPLSLRSWGETNLGQTAISFCSLQPPAKTQDDAASRRRGRRHVLLTVSKSFRAFAVSILSHGMYQTEGGHLNRHPQAVTQHPQASHNQRDSTTAHCMHLRGSLRAQLEAAVENGPGVERAEKY